MTGFIYPMEDQYSLWIKNNYNRLSLTGKPCINNGTCTDFYSGLITNETSLYKCDCDDFFNGLNCELDKDLCVNETCSKNGICYQKNKETKCKCFPFYSGSKCEIESNDIQVVKVTIRTASIIAIVIIAFFYLTFILADLADLCFGRKSQPKPKHRVKNINEFKRVALVYRP